MASSRKSQRSKRAETDLESRVAGHLRAHAEPGCRMVVGLSGGVDSVVLLDVLSRIAASRRFTLAALHVNHQISPNAGRWAAFCRAACRTRGISMRTVRVKVQGGDSLEAAARLARYDALLSQKADYIVLAHNQDDQAETMLLQLLRGAGVKGLAAMPLIRRNQGDGMAAAGQSQKLNRPAILRPLLDTPRAQIEAYAKKHDLAWIEDESNADIHFLRNYLRRDILPQLAGRFPAYRATLARSAGHFAEAAQLLDDLAVCDGGVSLQEDALLITGLRRLSHARAKNLLRHFLAVQEVVMPNTDRLEEALRQALKVKSDNRMRIDLGAFEMRNYDGALHVVRKPAHAVNAVSRAWQGESTLAMPELCGILTMNNCRDTGISLAKLQSQAVTVRIRCGGERLRPDCRRPRRTLKNLLQEAGFPPWRRDSLPLLFCGSELVWVPGIGIDCEFQAQAGETSVEPVWTAT